MRLRITVLAAAIAVFALGAVPGIAGAAPQHNRGLTIHAVPGHILAGDAVLIYGRLEGPGHANRQVRLYHRINPNVRFSLIGITRTNTFGEYEFTRAEGVVLSNRSWFVRGPSFSHSRTVHERVAALITLAASSVNGLTRHAIAFSGHLTPNHRGSVVWLQQQNAAGTGWHNLSRTVVGSGSNYQISHAWRVPGAYEVRALFRGDRRNTTAPSDPVQVLVQQTEVPDFTIQTSDPIVANQQPVTISGTLFEPGSTTAGEPDTSVSLFERVPGTKPFREVTTTTTSPTGTYQFQNVQSASNELYQVRTTFAPARRTAALFEGVQDVVTMSSSSQTSTVGGQVTFTGNVSPDKAGHLIYLQRLGKDSNWHTVEIASVRPNSTFAFGWTFGTAGTKQFRARITGGPVNVGSASTPPVIIDVTQPPLTSLPNS
jgi:hypothetical protein